MVRGNGKRRKSMNRKSKLFFSLVSLCFSIAVLCFGVYSALSVSYTVSGSVSYEIKDVFVELDLSVYRALSTTPVNSTTHNQNVSTIKDAGNNIPSGESGFSQLTQPQYSDHESTYEKGEVEPGNEDGIFEADSPNLALTYGSPTGNETQGYAFYIVIDIHNLGSEIINAQITTPTSLENTILRDSGNVEISSNGTEDDTKRIVLGLALDDVTTGIISAGFTYKITISRGELPAEPITDMLFSVNEATGTATLISYTGTGGDVVIPEKIGYDIVSSRTLTFNTMEDMVSGMNMMYFYQDLNIKLPNQEAAKHIENPMLWINENIPTIQKTPEDYFPMTIQTVDRYTIEQKEYAAFDQDAATMLAFGPIQMIRQNMLLTSVDVQYGPEKQSFTFNMENYNAAVNEGDDSETSTPIDEFMSKMETDPESLLPVTYSNFEYGFAVKGEEYFVTSIGSSAFRDCSNLTNIEIPSSVTSIGEDAFSGTPWLTNLQKTSYGIATASDGQTKFVIDVPTDITDDKLVMTNVKVIAGGAFSLCSNLTSIEIPSSVTSIGDSAFRYCNKLENITVDPNYANYCNDEYGVLFNKDKTELIQYPVGSNTRTQYTIPSSVTSIGNHAFNSCDALGTVTFEEDSQLKSIGEWAFSNCSKLTSIDIPSSVTNIGSYAFGFCDALETVTFGEDSQLKSIGYSAFFDCFKLTSIEIPSNVTTSIGDGAFSGCFSLTSIEIPSSVTSIGDSAFSGCDNLTSIEIPSSVTSIGDSAFNNCDALGTVTFGEDSKLESIGDHAFRACSNLTCITIPNSVTSIGDYAFWNCSNLTSIEIPSSVTSIGDSAFYNCSALETVTFKDTTTEWTVTRDSTSKTITSQELQSPSTMATYLRSTYYNYTWTKKQSA